MSMFDANGRQASKLDGAGFCAWVLRHTGASMPPPWTFLRWDDTRRTSWPGGPVRTDDVLAVLAHARQPECLGYLIVEIETELETQIFQRLGVYELLLALEVAPTAPGVVPVRSALLVLTGEQKSATLQATLEGTGAGTTVAPIVINLEKESAGATLADIAAGHTALCILPWIPLMAGGGERALIAEWKRVALTEANPERRVRYRDLALVFAELTKELINWQQALEGWEVRVSQTILGWKREGEVEGIIKTFRENVLDLVRVRLQDPVPEAIRLAVEGTNDPGTLRRWLRAAGVATTLDQFHVVMKTDA